MRRIKISIKRVRYLSHSEGCFICLYCKWVEVIDNEIQIAGHAGTTKRRLCFEREHNRFPNIPLQTSSMISIIKPRLLGSEGPHIVNRLDILNFR
jgi:hypothetical protein